jgi:hypothetical protein
VPDRDSRGTEHRADRLAELVRRGVRVRVRHDSLSSGAGRCGDREGRAPGRHPGRGVGDRAGQHPRGSEDGQAQGHRDPVPHAGPRTSTSWTSRPSRSGRWRPR